MCHYIWLRRAPRRRARAGAGRPPDPEVAPGTGVDCPDWQLAKLPARMQQAARTSEPGSLDSKRTACRASRAEPVQGVRTSDESLWRASSAACPHPLRAPARPEFMASG